MTANFHWAGESEAADVVARERALLSGMGSGKIEPVPWMVCSAFRSEFVAAGAYQRHGSALNLDACALKKTPVLARLTGGISVRWGPGVLHVALILPNASAWTETPMDRIINRYVRGMLTTLTSMGLEAAYHGKEFLYANGKHIGSLGFEIASGGAVLFECALALSGRWAIPEDVLGYPADESYLTGGFPQATLQELGWKDPSPEAMSRLIVSGFESRFGVQFEEATPVEEKQIPPRPPFEKGGHGGISELSSGASTGRAISRVSIGFVEALVAVDGPRIGHVELHGDFLADSGGVRALTGALIGKTFGMVDDSTRREEVTATIRSVFDQRRHVLLGIRPEELGSLIVRAGEDAQRAVAAQ